MQSKSIKGTSLCFFEKGLSIFVFKGNTVHFFQVLWLDALSQEQGGEQLA